MNYTIRGIQQIGIGVADIETAWKWYRENLGADIKVFDDDETANFMLPYTGGEVQRRRAILAVNLQGGGGFEIWQYKGRTSLAPAFDIQLGDLGIFAAKIGTVDVQKAHDFFTQKGEKVSNIEKNPLHELYFWLQDPFGNQFQVIQKPHKFSEQGAVTNLVIGAVVGVPDIDEALKVYRDILEYDIVAFDSEETKQYADFAPVAGGNSHFRRVILKHSNQRTGGFGKLFGPSEIELVQVADRTPRKMFEGRFWGDHGFIHLCFDMQGMDALRMYCAEKGYAFTVDSHEALKGNSFDMGDSQGQFSYIEDKGGTLIEFVEAHKLPLVKGLALNLKKRNPHKPIPTILLKMLRFKRYKEKK
ncbi:MAG: VOC family protein [Bacteroidales bacterium]|jgi:catechol 2,3-dioxygenase-like lactoylglutathione lyase family enzyme|nr:VOC family protein [Bacteroidales bacterium]